MYRFESHVPGASHAMDPQKFEDMVKTKVAQIVEAIRDYIASSFTAPISWKILVARIVGTIIVVIITLSRIANQYLPHSVRSYIWSKLATLLLQRKKTHVSIQIDKFIDGKKNQLFDTARFYFPLSSLAPSKH